MSNYPSDDMFDRAIAVGKKSNLIHKHGTIIIRNNEIVAEGTNHTRSNHKFSFHAETDALHKLKSKSKKYMEECTMVVVRVGQNNGNECLKLSRPCVACTNVIIRSGIRRVLYSVDDGLLFDTLLLDHNKCKC
jgi:tRNA(Arg) A34 adenosine deaminase TadA